MKITVTVIDDTLGLGYQGVCKYQYVHTMVNGKLTQRIDVKHTKFYRLIDLLPF